MAIQHFVQTSRIIHALCEAELVRGIFFGEGGLNSQQGGIVSIRRVQPPVCSPDAEPLNFRFLLSASRSLRNQPLREAYCIEKQLMLRERGEDQVNEQLLLHGHLMDLVPAWFELGVIPIVCSLTSLLQQMFAAGLELFI